MPLQLVPFVGGLQGHIDPRLLPDGALSDAVNVEFDLEGRVVGRARYQAIGSAVYGSGTFVGYDLFAVGDRLFALGDRMGHGFPSDVFEYTPGGVAPWSPSDRLSSGSPVRLPRATRLRDIGRPPDVAGGVSNFSVAALNGFVCLAYNNDDADGVDAGYLHVFLAEHDQTVLFDELTPSGNTVTLKLKALALSDRFVILGLNAAADRLGMRRFTPASDESSASVSTSLYSGLGTISAFAACKVDGSDQVVIVANCNGTLVTRRFDNAGVLQNPSGSAYADVTAAATRLAIYANATDNQIVYAYVVAGAVRVQSYNLATGATLDSAVAILAGLTASEIAILRFAANTAYVVASIADGDDEDSIYAATFTVGSAGAGINFILMTDATLTSTVISHASELVFACRYGSAATGPTKGSNALASVSPSSTDELNLLALKDLETACPPGVHLPEIVLDSTAAGGRGRYYWANATLGPDGDGGPVVTEFGLGLAERRQLAVLGGHVYIAGGMPCVYDLRFLCESGFAERPRIISLTGGSGGSLLPGATYKYRVHAEQVDSVQDLHLSPPSEISEITLSSSQNKVTAKVSTGHSMRRNASASFAGIAQRSVLSRTLATAETTPAVLQGVAVLTPPDGDLDGLTLDLVVTDAAGSPTSYTVTFAATDDTAAEVATKINTTTSADITASSEGQFLRLTTVDEGEGVTLTVVSPSTAAELLGLEISQTDEGTTDRTIGENFQRAASGYNPTADLPGEFIEIVDTRADESDPIVDTDLIRQQPLYSQGIASGAHHAPPPAEFVWAGRSRILWSGQHRRNRYTASKTVVPGEPAECAFEGFLAFSGLVTGDIEAGCMLGDGMAFWTRTQIWIVTGSGPARSGQGEFFDPQCVSRRLGIIADGWRSLVEDDDGVWFQGNDGELYHLSRGGAVTWRGKEIQSYLTLYPKITAATIRGAQQDIAFAVTAADGLTGGILRYNVEGKAWAFDDVGAVTALADYQGRLAYVQSGTVYLQDASPGSGTGPNYHVASGMFQGFGTLGYGQLNEVGVLGTFRGDCTVTLKRSRNGTSYPDTLATWSLTTARYSVGDRVVLLKAPNPAMQDSFALRVEVSGMSSSEGVWLHAFGLDTERSPYPSRQGPANRQ